MNKTAAPSLTLKLVRMAAAVLFVGAGSLAWHHHLGVKELQAQQELREAQQQLARLEEQKRALQDQLLWLKTDPEYLQLRMRETALLHRPGNR